MARMIETKLTTRDCMEAAQDNPRAWRGIKTEPGAGMIRRRPEPSTMIERARRFIVSIVKRPR